MLNIQEYRALTFALDLDVILSTVVSIKLQSIIIIRHRPPISSVSSTNESILNEWSRVRDICLLHVVIILV